MLIEISNNWHDNESIATSHLSDLQHGEKVPIASYVDNHHNMRKYRFIGKLSIPSEKHAY